MARVRSLYRRVFHRPAASSLPKQVGADLVFCPFTAPKFYDPAVPIVVVVYDLQYLYYPQFFTADERYYRDKDFRESCHLATHLVCISDYVRETVLHNGAVAPERVTTVHIRLSQRLDEAPAEAVESILARLNLEQLCYLLYPANFWPHKNHEMLLTAFGIYRARHPQSNLKLVCTGSPGERMDFLSRCADRMGLNQRVIFPGYLSDAEFAAVMSACYAVIYPSLFEGFGMPILEAMACGKPVLCSNVTGLPEIAGDAALMFNPRKPIEIVNAIESIENDHSLVQQLKQLGAQRVMAFGQPIQMAQHYLQIFYEAVSGSHKFAPVIHGIYADGWSSERVTITYGVSNEQRYFEAKLTAPTWLPFEQVAIRLLQNGNGPSAEFVIARGQTASLATSAAHGAGISRDVGRSGFSATGIPNRRRGCMYDKRAFSLLQSYFYEGHRQS